MLPILNLPTGNKSIIKGDTWGGFNATITLNNNPIDLTGATVRLWLYHNTGTITKLESGAGITVLNAVNGTFKIDSINRLNWKAGRHTGDLELTYSDGSRKTYIQVNINVTDDFTK
jgi:hypothetical protein